MAAFLMKVLIISKFLYPDKIGGVEVHVHKVAEELVQHGHTVAILTVSRTRETCRYKILTVKLLPRPLSELSFFIEGFVKVCLYPWNIIHVHYAGLSALLVAYFMKILKHVPYVVTCHGSDIHKQNHFLSLHSFLLKKADKITCVSSELINILNFRYGIKEGIQKIPNGFDKQLLKKTSFLQGEKSRKCITFVGSLRLEKDPITFLQAIKLLSSSSSDFKVLIVGTGPLYNEVKQFIKANSLNSIVQMLQPMPQEELFKLVELSDIIIISSITEGLPTFLIECMALGKSVIATNVGGIPDIVKNGINGILVPPKSPQSIFNALERLLANPELKKRLGRAAKESVKDYTWNKIAEKYEIIYREVISKGKVT